MNHILGNTGRRLGAVALAALASGALVACGSSSTTTTTTTNAAANASTNPAGRTPGARFNGLRECLQKQGITLPQRKGATPGSGQRPQGGAGGFFGGGAGGGLKLPSGVSRSQFEAALKKCDAGRFGFQRGSRLGSPQFKQNLEKFATCMRSNGVNVPAPNTSGKGPIFDTKGLDTSSAKFQAAEQKCSPLIRAGFARPGQQGAPPGGPAGGPPAGGGEAPPGA